MVEEGLGFGGLVSVLVFWEVVGWIGDFLSFVYFFIVFFLNCKMEVCFFFFKVNYN